MQLSIQIIIILVALICFLGGANLVLKGAHSFLPAGTPPQRVLDNLMRFLSGIYFGMGFLLSWVVIHITETQSLVYFIGIVVICSGLGRMYSRMRVGTAGKYFDVIMLVEMALGLSLIILQVLR